MKQIRSADRVDSVTRIFEAEKYSKNVEEINVSDKKVVVEIRNRSLPT